MLAPQSMTSRSRALIAVAATVLLLMVLGSLHSEALPSASGLRHFQSSVTESLSNLRHGKTSSQQLETDLESAHPDQLQYPIDYRPPSRSPWCESRYSTELIDTMANNHTEFCATGSSSLQCFTTPNIGSHKESDYFCVADGVVVKDKKFHMSCGMTPEKEAEYKQFPEYIMWTGTRTLIQDYFKLSTGPDIDGQLQSLQCRPGDKRRAQKSTAVLFKRDGGFNMWHSLMEIMAYYISMDVLSVAKDGSGKPYFDAATDANDFQVIWTDDNPSGLFHESWPIYSTKPSIHLSELDPSVNCYDRVIISLPGAANTLWEGDWEPRRCHNSTLLDAFRRRLLRQLDVVDGPDPDDAPSEAEKNKLTVTFIDRRRTRVIEHLDEYITILRTRYPQVHFQTIDLAKTTFQEQLRVFTKTNLLVGSHGAGLTGLIFQPDHSNVVELLPEGFMHKGFRHVAALRGHRYFSVHGKKAPGESTGDNEEWRRLPVRVDEGRFMKVLDAAILSMFNLDFMNEDAA